MGHRNLKNTVLCKVINGLMNAGCEIRGDDEVIKLNIYGKNSEFIIEDSPRYTAKREAYVNFNNSNNY